jgi:amino acid permease
MQPADGANPENKNIYRMSLKANFFVTLFCVTVPYVLSLFLSSLGDSLALIGSTTNPTSGFIIPILFYWKLFPDKSIFSREKLPSFITGVIIVAVSIINLLNFFLFKEN